MKTKLKKVLSICLSFLIISSFCISNCFGMRPNRLGQSGPTRQTNTQRRVFRGPPPPPPVPHKKWVSESCGYATTFSWLELGIDVGSTLVGVALEQYVAKQLASKFVSRMGTKWATDLAKSIKWSVPILQRLASNDLKKLKGIKVEIHWDFIKSEDCKCIVSQDHGVDHGILPIKNIKYNIYIV